MHGLRLSGGAILSRSRARVLELQVAIRTSLARFVIRTTSVLVTVIGAKVAKTEASFLAFGVVDTWKHNALSS